jgi:hypothetical protein
VSTEQLAVVYQQLNASVGSFGTDTLIADSAALASGSGSNDSSYTREQQVLRYLADARDRLATIIKRLLSRAAAGARVPPADI